MKFLMTALLLMLTTTVCRAGDQVITVKELPAAAQKMLNQQFKGKQVTLVKKDSEVFSASYDVLLEDGTKLEFDSKGEWTEIETKPQAVPAVFVPKAISDYVKKNYPKAKIVQIQRDRSGYEIDLSNGLDIKFDKKFRVREIDD